MNILKCLKVAMHRYYPKWTWSAGEKELVQRAQENAGVETEIIRRAYGKKMSRMLIKIAQPFLDQSEDFQEAKNILQLAALAWNYGISTPQVRAQIRKEQTCYYCVGKDRQHPPMTFNHGSPLDLSYTFICGKTGSR
jgi:hypothetical protein